ncbi:Membrane dipeptidase OS=Ureibacillus acetophenoni OX=614649 GN=SAMN05877842_102592 PE=4 SV=1 [Ureibacillus acetophenoni]
MKIIDLHCDVLNKLSRFEDMSFLNDPRLDSNFERLKAGNVKVQVFAIYVHPKVPIEQRFQMALKQVEAFKKFVLTTPGVVHITEWEQIKELQEDEFGAVLSLEGCDCIGTDIEILKVLLDAGVKLVGLTWNYENDVAYGNLEDPNKGLKPFAKTVINYLNERDIILDVAHLNDAGFYELISLAKHVIASHSNSRTICANPRNLTDEQVKLIIEKGGRVHVVFYPPFIENEMEQATIPQIIDHIKHLVKLVGVENVGFGSDFDGIDFKVDGLTNASEYQNLTNALLQHFSEEEVRMMSYNGFEKYVLSLKA